MEYGGFNVFVRDWWRKAEPGEPQWYNGGIVPYPGAPRRYLARGVSEERARELCTEYASKHKPGWRSRKAEYESA